LIIVVDLNSTSGTYVNGRKITSPFVVGYEQAAVMNRDPRTSCLRASESGNAPKQTRRVSYLGSKRENRKSQWLAPPANVCVRSRRMPRVA
jgi:pSer/pThr/pTyr-binding forkhead associated (FHA) protein